MPIARSHHSAVLIDDCNILIYGGRNDTKFIDTNKTENSSEKDIFVDEIAIFDTL